jgi:hypothetical protein
MKPRTIVIAGSIAQKPSEAGHTWVFLQYLLGFAGLGWDVLLLDRLEPAMCRDGSGLPCAAEASEGFTYLLATLKQFDLDTKFAVICGGGERCLGLDRQNVLDRVKNAELLFNFNGFLPDGEIRAAAKRRVYVDIDPGFAQMWKETGLHDAFAGHDDFITIGLNIGRPDCPIPTCGLKWLTTVQPIVLQYWPVRAPMPGGSVTAIGAWRGPNAPVDFRGKRYGLRVHEFRKFADVPLRTGKKFFFALDIDPSETADIDLLQRGGWTLIPPRPAAVNPDAYQRFIAESAGEFMVAKNMYVQSRCGWISDRSICYLASGRPVVAQDTGIEKYFPAGKGLLLFSNPEEAVDRIRDMEADYASHARLARRLAEEVFCSQRVLPELLGKLNL